MRCSRVAAVVTAALVVAALSGCGCAQSNGNDLSTSPQPSADYTKGYTIGLEAYTYGLPLLTTNKTFLTQTSVNVSNGAFGPVNQFNSVRSLNNAGSKSVVAAGANGLSSIAWLDLTKEPQVLHVPKAPGHFFVLGMIDPYTTNIRDLGSASATKPGDYVIAGPHERTVPIPAGTERIDVDYDRIWIIGSTQLKGPSDVANVNKIQDGYTLTPLSKYGTSYHPPAPSDPVTTPTTYQVPTGLQFFDTLGQQLAMFPPPAADKAELSKFAEVGIGPGLTPSTDSRLSSDTIRGLSDAVTAGPAQLKKDTEALFLAGFGKHDGYLLGGFGRYGTDYRRRAVISQIGLGAFTPDQSIYALSSADHSGKPLTGSSSYVLHMPSAPPAEEGWSLTVYNLQGTMIPNPLDRYQFSNASTLTKNADGSVDIYLQSTRPTSSAQVSNWLPTAGGQGFEVIWRLLAPQPDKVGGILDGTGWQPPAIDAASG